MRSLRMIALSKNPIPRYLIKDLFILFPVNTDHEAIIDSNSLYAELSSDGEFYAKTLPDRKTIQSEVDRNRVNRKWDYANLVGLFAYRIEKYKKETSKNTRLIVAKLFVDYYLDELELGNVIYNQN